LDSSHQIIRISEIVKTLSETYIREG